MSRTLETVEPGSRIDCEHCSQSAIATLHEGVIECSECCAQLEHYELATAESVSTSLDPEKSHHGPGARPGDRASGSTIDTRGVDASGNRLSGPWAGSSKRLARIDRRNASKHIGSRQRRRAKRLIRQGTPEGGLRTLALDLLDIGWPEPGAKVPDGFSPMWRDGHPWGTGSSAAACKLMASNQLGIDCRISELAAEMLPDVELRYARKGIFRSLKSLRRILGTPVIRGLTHRTEVMAILSRVNLGQTGYRNVSLEFHELVGRILDSEECIFSPPRSLLAALLHLLADRSGLRVSKVEITDMFGCSLGYYKRIAQADELVRRFL